MNPKIAAKVMQGLSTGVYTDSPDTLLEDIKGDVALASYLYTSGCLTWASSTSQPSNAAVKTFKPTEIAKVLNERVSGLTPHKMDSITEQQAAALRYVITCTTTTEVIAEEKGIDSERAFFCGLIRQLGYALITFNYPTVLRRALLSVNKNGGLLSQALESILGYSPTMLAVKLMELGKLGEDIRPLVLKQFSPTNSPEDTEILQCCKTAEALAQADYPEAFPDAIKNWGEILTDIQALIGNDTLSIIQDRVEQRLVSYLEYSPEIFGIKLDTAARNLEITDSQYNPLLDENIACAALTTDARKEFNKVYNLILPSKVSPLALNELVASTIPYLGFSGGCLYLFRSSGQVLVPRLRLGKTLLSSYREVPLSMGGPLGRAIGEAFIAKRPIVERDITLHERIVSHISWSIMDEEDVGVLHLELGDKARDYVRRDLELYFRALRQAFVHILQLDKRG